jgi:hypothetical protein
MVVLRPTVVVMRMTRPYRRRGRLSKTAALQAEVCLPLAEATYQRASGRDGLILSVWIFAGLKSITAPGL